MATCETCGNDYANLLEITVDGTRHVFDSFECAIHFYWTSSMKC